MKTQKLIIGCGYLGQRAAVAWIEQGESVAALTRSSRNAEKLAQIGVTPVIGDVTSRESLASLPAADTILYSVGFDRNAESSKREVYVDGLQNLLEVNGDRCRRFIYISSTSVYGQSNGEWIDETSPCVPTTEGGQICLEAEQVVSAYFRGNRTDEAATAICLRLAGIYGPGRVLARVDALKSGLPLAGRPDSWLNLIHVDDAVSAVLAAEQRAAAGETYLICDGRPAARREYYSFLASSTGAPAPTFDASQPTVRGGGGLNKRCRNQRMLEELGVKPAYADFRVGLMQALG